MSPARQLHLNLFHTASGYHDSAWRLPDADPLYGMTLDYHVELAQAAEAACFDSIFFAHSFYSWGAEKTNCLLRWDPLVVLGALAARTRHIGLIGTMSTSFTQPYHLAQAFATLDQVSGGRAAWNIVTSATNVEAHLFGIDDLPDSAARYRRAAEYVEICQQLWTSWADDAFAIDKESGLFTDLEKVRGIAHRGDSFAVEGKFHLPPTPQRGGPVRVQAGDSEEGKNFAGQYAEVMYTVQSEIGAAKEFYADMKSRAAAHGRDPESIVIMPGLTTLVAASEAEAHAREQELAEVAAPESGLRLIKEWCEVDLSGYPLDEPAPPLPDVPGAKSSSRLAVLRDYARRRNPTLRQLLSIMSASRGHHLFIGTGEQLADVMQEWFEEGAADGFNVSPLVLPSGIHDFAREVVPILQQRGLLRTRYEGTTLRDHLGLTAAPPLVAA